MTEVGTWISLNESRMKGVKRISLDKALHASNTHRYDYLDTYVAELAQVVDIDKIRKWI